MTISEFNKRKEFNRGADRIINHWETLDIHDLSFPGFTEADFFCCDGSKVILLRVRVNMKDRKLCISNNGQTPYWIAEIVGSTIDDVLLSELLIDFSNMGQ